MVLAHCRGMIVISYKWTLWKWSAMALCNVYFCICEDADHDCGIYIFALNSIECNSWLDIK